MNGPEHYARAEQLLAHVMADTAVHNGDVENLAAAQVHATLALAAATAEAAPDSPVFGPLVQRPLPEGSAFEGAPASTGSPWGQVLR